MLGLPFIFKSAGWFGGLFVTISFSSVGKYTNCCLLSFGARPILSGDESLTLLLDANIQHIEHLSCLGVNLMATHVPPVCLTITQKILLSDWENQSNHSQISPVRHLDNLGQSCFRQCFTLNYSLAFAFSTWRSGITCTNYFPWYLWRSIWFIHPLFLRYQRHYYEPLSFCLIFR